MNMQFKSLGLSLLCMSMLGSCVETIGAPGSSNYGSVIPRAKVIDSKELLNAHGSWEVVEQGKSYDPAEAHMNARKKVNIKRRSKKNELEAHFKPNAKSGEDGKIRILKMKNQGQNDALVSSGYGDKLVLGTIVKPTHFVADNELVKRVVGLFGQRISDGHGYYDGRVIVPKVKPRFNKHGDVVAPVVKISAVLPVIKEVVLLVPPAIPERKKPKAVTEISSDAYIIPKRKPLRAQEKKAVHHVTLSVAKRPKADVRPASIVKLRSGIYDHKTRIVIEVDKTSKYKIAIDGLRNVLRIRIKDARWGLKERGGFDESALLGTYVARDQDDGSVLFEVRLKKPTRIVDTMFLRPNTSSKHRIVVDLQ